jgi:hypothetical protein
MQGLSKMGVFLFQRIERDMWNYIPLGQAPMRGLSKTGVVPQPSGWMVELHTSWAGPHAGFVQDGSSSLVAQREMEMRNYIPLGQAPMRGLSKTGVVPQPGEGR